METTNIGIQLYQDLEKSLENYGVLTEAYVGKTPNLLKAEQAMTDICNFILAKKEGRAKGRVMDHKAYKELVKYLSIEFGISTLDLTFTEGVAIGMKKLKIDKETFDTVPQMVNYYGATTIPLIDPIKNSLKNVAFKSGKSDSIKGKKSVCIFISTDLVSSYGATPGEMMALLLHEIGHSFNSSVIITILGFVSMLYAPVTFISASIQRLFTTSLFSTTAKMTNRLMPQFMVNLFTKINDILLPYMQIGTYYSNNMTAVSKIYKLFLDPKVTHEERKTNLYSLITLGLSDYIDERQSDSFATSFGYGPELVSCLRKVTFMTERAENMFKPGSDTTAFDVLTSFSEVVLTIVDPHPTSIMRAKHQINKLNKDLASIDDPKMKKIISEQVATIQKMYDNYYTKENTTTDMNKYRAILDNILKGKEDWRSMLFEPFIQSQEL